LGSNTVDDALLIHPTPADSQLIIVYRLILPLKSPGLEPPSL
jgi:hypothetical protein